MSYLTLTVQKALYWGKKKTQTKLRHFVSDTLGSGGACECKVNAYLCVAYDVDICCLCLLCM